MKKQKLRPARTIARGVVTALTCGALLCTQQLPAALASTTSWTPPTSSVSTTFEKDGETWRYMTASSAISGSWLDARDLERFEYFGVNTTLGYWGAFYDNWTPEGAVQTSDPNADTHYTKSGYLGFYGSEANKNPDPYISNLFYNFYVDEHSEAGLEKSSDAALLTSNANQIQDGYGTSGYLMFRPDILYPGYSGNYLSTLLDGVKSINDFDEESEYYKAPSSTYVGDKKYDPVIAYREPEGMISGMQSMRNVAQAVKDVQHFAKKKNLNITTRYGEDPDDVANKYEMYIRATEYYILSQIAAGKVKMKRVYYIESVSEDGKIIAIDPRGTEYTNAYCDYTQHGSLAVVDNPVRGRNENPNSGIGNSGAQAEITLAEAATADVLVMSEPDNGGNTAMAYDDNSAEVYAKRLIDLFDKNGYDDAADRPIFTTLGNMAVGSNARSSAGNVQVYAWANAFVYPELLNSVHMTAYFYDKFYHLNTNALSDALTLNLSNKLSLPEGQSLADLDTYDAKEIESKFETGMKYYLAHENEIEKANPELKATDELKEAYSYLKETTEPTPSKTSTVTATKKAQKITVKTVKKTYKGSKYVKSKKLKKNQTFKIDAKASGKGKLTYKVTKKDPKKKVTFKNGKVTVKKGTKAGTYKVKVQIIAAANGSYKKATKSVTIKVVVKKK